MFLQHCILKLRCAFQACPVPPWSPVQIPFGIARGLPLGLSRGPERCHAGAGWRCRRVPRPPISLGVSFAFWQPEERRRQSQQESQSQSITQRKRKSALLTLGLSLACALGRGEEGLGRWITVSET